MFFAPVFQIFRLIVSERSTKKLAHSGMKIFEKAAQLAKSRPDVSGRLFASQECRRRYLSAV
jgi:hypothetical protein